MLICVAYAVYNVLPGKSRPHESFERMGFKSSKHVEASPRKLLKYHCTLPDEEQNYVDRNAIAQARLNNLEKDLGMTGVQFNTTVSILFVGYVLMQVPSNMLITRIKPGIYMSSWMLVWAVVSGCTALVQSFGGLVACRFFLGITEAPFYPGATYMLSIFYTRKGMLGDMWWWNMRG